MGYRLGVDVGGTFTDILMFDEKGGRSFRSKLPSTPADPSKAVVAGVKALCDKVGVAPAEITHFLHGTTVTTNAVLEGKGARVGLVVTEGYRQILQIARSLVPGGLAAWIIWPKPQPMARLEDTVEVSGRIDGRGAVVREIDAAQVRVALQKLKASGVEAVTVCLMNAYLNPAHERVVGEVAREVFGAIPVSLSCDILPEMYEYERALTTVANSAVRPIIRKYVSHLERDLKEIGVKAPINLLRSDGGLMSAQKSQDAPVNLLMSGPAGGVSGALWVARQAGLKNVLTLDVGGTSTDVALIEKGEPRLTRETEVGHLSVRAPSLDVKTVGAGGGSIAHVPELTRALRVGPDSAGAVPGPAAYGKSGDRATVTDAHVVLGNLPTALLGGAFELDRAASERVVKRVADGLGVGLFEAAQGIIDIANENMFGALRMISVQQGYDPRDFALMPFGGAGALHACAVAKLLHSWPVVVPRAPGVLCALGDATTRSRAEFSRSFSKRAIDTSSAEIVAAFAEMKARVTGDLAAESVSAREAEFRFEIDVRYYGQGFELPIPVADASASAFDLAKICADFDAEHRRMFMFNMETAHEIVNLRVVGLGPAPELPHEMVERGDGDPKRALLRGHRIQFGGAWREGGLYDRALLRAGDVVKGPAIITEMDSTTLLHPDCVAKVDAFGNLVITPGDRS
jgi:N-methylhydantoinase A